MNNATLWCRDTKCASGCSGKAGCIAGCQKGCNLFAQVAPKGPWLTGACHLDEGRADTTLAARNASCQSGYPGSVSNVQYCQVGCLDYDFSLSEKRGL